MRRRPGDSALEAVLCCGLRVLGKGAATSAAPSSTPASSQHVVHRTPSPCVVTSFLRSKDRKKRLPANHVTTQNNILNAVPEIRVIKLWPEKHHFSLMKLLEV